MSSFASSHSLPDTVKVLRIARKQYLEDFTNLQKELNDHQENLQKAVKRREQSDSEGCEIYTRYIDQDELKRKARLKCASLQTDKSRLIKAKNELLQNIEKKKIELERNKRMKEEYGEKAAAYVERVRVAEQDDATMCQLNEIKAEVENLQAHRNALQDFYEGRLMSFDDGCQSLQDVHTHIALKENIIQDKYAVLISLEKQLQTIQQRKASVVTKNTILTNRNTARLTRMTKRIQQEKEKHSVLTGDIERKEKAVDGLRESNKAVMDKMNSQ